MMGILTVQDPKGCMQFLLVALSCIWQCAAFNVDLPSRIRHTSDQPESMFGFAVALHSDSNGVKRLLVGAPSYDTSFNQTGVHRGGAVLKCSTERQDSCEYVPFDIHGNQLFENVVNLTDVKYGFDVSSSSSNGNNRHPIGEVLDEKSRQWFGATLFSTKTRGGTVV
ncbi:integrin alpha-PS2-like, partial [Hyalella azteca]|uniref:Integrin alpha-PS2-like n=1 Tax=Hyalella azteca TaxID=294128 RepID=A0A8B7PH43_HYAAZ